MIGANVKTPVDVGADSAALQRLASVIIANWDAGEPADALREFELHPDLARHKSTALQLAYEEYCKRLERGEAIDRQSFCRRFREFSSSLNRLLEVESVLLEGCPRAIADDQWPKIGSRVLGFDVLEELGRGGFGRVYLAREAAVADRLVVIKVAGSAEREAKLLGRFDHPNIVPILSVSATGFDAQSLICMPFLGRTTLQDVLDLYPSGAGVTCCVKSFRELVSADVVAVRSPGGSFVFSRHGSYVDIVVRLALGICRGLTEAHRKSILHLDLKPSNVLLGRNGEPMLLDFSLAVDIRDAALRLGGTLPYMAPEQISVAYQIDQPPARIDARADLFSLGAVMYELLTGVRPFEMPGPGLPLVDIAAITLHKRAMPIPPVRTLNKEVNKSLDRLIRSLLAFDPANRPESAEKAAQLITRQLRSDRRIVRWSHGHAKSTIGLAGIGLLTLVTGIHAWHSREPFAIREYQSALSDIARGHLESASLHLNNALSENSLYNDALLARARIRLRQNKLEAALADFEAAAKIATSDAALEGQGYCLARKGRCQDAIACFRKMSTAGLANPALANNFGYCLAMERKTSEAETWFSRALSPKNPPQAAYYNRAILDLRRALEQHAPKYVPDRGIRDISRAIEIGPACGELHYVRACLNAVVGGDKLPVDRVISDLTLALRMGIPPRWLKREALLQCLIARPAIHVMLNQKPNRQAPNALFQPLIPPQ